MDRWLLQEPALSLSKGWVAKLIYFRRMFPPCIFCNNESGSEEHLWAAWMHRLLKFGPIRVQEGTGPETIDPDPEKTINTVCHTCNNTWMSQLEEKNIPSLRPMLQNQPTMIDPGRQRLLTEWESRRRWCRIRLSRGLAMKSSTRTQSALTCASPGRSRRERAYRSAH